MKLNILLTITALILTAAVISMLLPASDQETFKVFASAPQFELMQPDVLKVDFYDKSGDEVSIPYEVAGQQLRLNPGTSFTPGSYSVHIFYSDGSHQTLKFGYGVLAVNTDKAEYSPFEQISFSMAVLDDVGEMICDAPVGLLILDQAGAIVTTLSDSEISVSDTCDKKQAQDGDDYSALLRTGLQTGEYTVIFEAEVNGIIRQVETPLFVSDQPRYSIRRTGPTRIYPPNTYEMKIELSRISSETTVTEVIPAEITPTQYTGTLTTGASGEQYLSWKVRGETTLTYQFQTPEKSPAFYQLGPLKIDDYTEPRLWQLAIDAGPVFRVTTYEVETGVYTGATYTLNLNNTLSSDYFTMVSGPDENTGSRGPDDDGVRITADPFGNFGSTTGVAQLELTRVGTADDWIGAVTVVECLNDCTGSGFQLSEVREVSLATGTASALQTVTDTLSSTHTTNTVPMGARFGGGMTSTATSNNQYGVSLGVRIYKSSTNQITYERYGGTGQVPGAATVTTYIVEWGSDWTVQEANIVDWNTGGAGADATGEYTSASISSVTRANTWVWASPGTSQEDGLGDASFGKAIALGDGVNQNVTETNVSIGSEFNSNLRRDTLYVLEHSDLSVDWQFKTDGDAGPSTGYQELTNTVPGALGAESYDNASSTIRYTEGYRIGFGYFTSNGNGQAYSRAGGWAFRYTADTTLTRWRSYAGQNHAGWVQSVDFADIIDGPSTTQIHYRWRDDTTALNTTGGWLAAEDTQVIDALKSTTYRLRISVANLGTSVEAAAKTYELQWGTAVSGNCSLSASWVGVDDTADEVAMAASPNITDGQSTSALMTNAEGYTFVAGEGRDVTDTTGSIGPLASLEYTELEYSISFSPSASSLDTYCFRLYDTANTTVLDSYIEYPAIVLEQRTIEIGEYGSTTLTDNNWTTINTTDTYGNMVVVATAEYAPDADPARAPRVRNKTTDSFEIKVDDYTGGFTGSTPVTYFVMEAGDYDINNGSGTTRILAGSTSVSGNFCNSSTFVGTPTTVSLSPVFSAPPVVLAGVSTENDTDWTVVLADDGTQGNPPSTSTLRLSLNTSFENCNTNTHAAETVDYIAMDESHGTHNGFEFDFVNTIDNVSCCNTSGYAGAFSQSFVTGAPVTVLGHQLGENGGNGGYAVVHPGTATTTTDAYLSIDEDGTSADRTHTAETVGIAAFENASGTFEIPIFFELSDYRWYSNNDSTDVGSPLAAQNTAVEGPTRNTPFRLRFLVEMDLNELPLGNGVFKLQAAPRTGATCETNMGTSDEVYTDVSASSGTIRYYDNTTPVDNDPLTSNANDPTSSATINDQTYNEDEPISNDVSAIPISEAGLFDVALVDNSVAQKSVFCFRVVLDTGSDTLDLYSFVPEITLGVDNDIIMRHGSFIEDGEEQPFLF